MSALEIRFQTRIPGGMLAGMSGKIPNRDIPSRYYLTVPNLICGTRFLLAPVLLILAWNGSAGLYTGFLITAFLLDMIDGPVARWTGQLSDLGPRLDSLADFSIFITLPAGVWWLWPEIIIQECIFVALMLGSLILPPLIGLIKFHAITSYHTWLAKLAVTLAAISAVLLVLGGPAWPLRVATVFCVLAAIEEIAITWILKRPVSDVKTICHVLKRRIDSR